jgi:hypothetical protein
MSSASAERQVYGSTWNLVDLSLKASRNWVPVRVTLRRWPSLTPVTVMLETRQPSGGRR